MAASGMASIRYLYIVYFFGVAQAAVRERFASQRIPARLDLCRRHYCGRDKHEPQKDPNHAPTRLRGYGELTITRLKTRTILCKLRCCPTALVASQSHLRLHARQTGS